MTHLADLSKSVSEMTEEELFARIRHLRLSRTTTPPTPVKKVAAKKAATPSTIDPTKLDPEAAAGLLALLEGMLDD